MGRVISSKIKEFGFLMPSFQFYFEFNNLKDKDFSFCIMCLGQDISLVDLINFILFVHIMIALVYYYKQLHSYVDSKMQDVALNSIGLISEMVNVHFISHARVDNFQHLYNWQIVKMFGYKIHCYNLKSFMMSLISYLTLCCVNDKIKQPWKSH